MTALNNLLTFLDSYTLASKDEQKVLQDILTWKFPKKTMEEKAMEYLDTVTPTERPYNMANRSKKTYTPRPTYTKNCIVCGKKYKTKRPEQKYCGQKCHGVDNRKQYNKGKLWF